VALVKYQITLHMPTQPPSHDQNFKNLILDYPRQALQFFAPQEAFDVDEHTSITPIRQEQLKNRLGDRFHELDVPLKVEWPDGRRAALLFLLEEESDPARFSIHRLGRYCLDLSELMETNRIVPVVIFLRSSPNIPKELHLGGDHHTFLSFDYIACVLPDIPAEEHKDSPNIVARITLPTMRYARQQVVDVVAWALRGLNTLETNGEKYLKYLDFVQTYGNLTEQEQQLFTQRYSQEKRIMTSWLANWSEQMLAQSRQEGQEQGREQGRQEGEATVLLRQLTRRFGPLGAPVTQQIRQANLTQLEQWADNILDARSLEEVFGKP